MSWMVRHVAKAMSENEEARLMAGHIQFMSLARAAIAAMREPTDEMEEAANEVSRPALDGGNCAAWQAMIDEALK